MPHAYDFALLVIVFSIDGLGAWLTRWDEYFLRCNVHRSLCSRSVPSNCFTASVTQGLRRDLPAEPEGGSRHDGAAPYSRGGDPLQPWGEGKA